MEITRLIGPIPRGSADNGQHAAASALSPIVYGDSIVVGNHQPADGLACAADAATGIAADRIAPQRFRLKAITRGSSNAMLVDTRSGKLRPGSTKPAGLWVVRSDGPHNNHVTTHLNVNGNITGVHDPHIPISTNVYRSAGALARGMETVGRAAAPVAIGADTIRIGVAIHEDVNKVGPATQHAAAGIAGGWVGALSGAVVGAEGGAAAGGALGTFAGGVGAAPGAAVGGVVGGIGGAIAGGLMGDRVAQHAVDGFSA